MEIAFKVQWTETAVLNLKNIYDYYYLKTNKVVAQRLIQKIINTSRILESNP
jgi:plasmid stabilization system protein ParE